MHANRAVTINASTMAGIVPVHATPGGTDPKFKSNFTRFHYVLADLLIQW